MRSCVRQNAQVEIDNLVNKNIAVTQSLPVQSCNDSAYGAPYDISLLGMAPCQPTEAIRLERSKITRRHRGSVEHLILNITMMSYRCVVNIGSPYAREK